MWSLASASADAVVEDVGGFAIGGRGCGAASSSAASTSSSTLAVSSSSGSLARRADGVALLDADQADALGVAADHADVGDAGPDDDAAGGRQHHLVGVGHLGDRHDRAVAVGGLDVDQPLAAPVLRAVLGQGGPLAVAPARRRSGGSPGRRRRWPRPCR